MKLSDTETNKKKCNICHKVRLLKFYHKHKGCGDGYRNYCKDCANELMRNYRKSGKTTLSGYSNVSTAKLKVMLKDIEKELISRA